MAQKLLDGPKQLIKLIELLNKIPKNSPLASAAIYALDLIKSDLIIEAEISFSEAAQSSKYFANLYEFRSKSGYFLKTKIIGILEMIECMGMEDVPVHLVYIKMSHSLISLWLSAVDDSIRGLLIIGHQPVI